MLFIPLFVLVLVLALPCMSNYRKIYASSDQLICSLSNDFLHFFVVFVVIYAASGKRDFFTVGDKSFQTTTVQVDMVEAMLT